MKQATWILAAAAAIFTASAAIASERAINEKITVKANVDDVWKAWTTTEGVKSFFAPDAKVELRGCTTAQASGWTST